MSRRRSASFPAAKPSAGAQPWELRYQAWVLVTPAGGIVHLSAAERICMLGLLAHPRRELTRAALVQSLPGLGAGAINVVISRLRRKVGETGEVLPLRTVHGMGYVFLAGLRSDTAPPQATPAAG
ncbi:helix-turn-helix domain-containing protein [Bordetella bronchiseptica]|uniref:helix-turn-helix domain-containing protein n=1 Tax=Bordetella bronchiseptica TaxID=518 RepID=UPI000461B057|nr:helix-turn-helix domain-containing protein [Bordetella bronchiseptica]AUL15052.1 DNA-binding protein [Bordetella bronchiseptica]AWP58150.1 DNA-binding protein [Bordetella bronchiseptica]KDB77917.1 transcriptional regulatory protein, C-terminal domain protein [Bordetella bronchiseptica CA90 BB1334]KDC13268.1 transcriptional regulatory protein, C-terminal domain protein [Bordetella bronchiseptica E014]KDC19171.1 transcriptional regulatory protein, C-terminal domain protein [Bordetella bronchi